MSGWVIDADTGRPLANVRIRLDQGRAEEQTNTRGYYALSVPAPPKERTPNGELAGLGTFIAQLPGYKTAVVKNLSLPEGQGARLNFQLERGSGTLERDDKHRFYPRDNASNAPGQALEILEQITPIAAPPEDAEVFAVPLSSFAWRDIRAIRLNCS